MYFKSKSCKSSKNQHLVLYKTEVAIQGAVAYTLMKYKTEDICYRCKNCGYFHLAPKDRQTQSSFNCGCLDPKGEYKRIYATKEDARK